MDLVPTENIELTPLDQIPDNRPVNRHVNYSDPHDPMYSHAFSEKFLVHENTGIHQRYLGGGSSAVATEFKNNSNKKALTGTYTWDENGNSIEFDNFKPKRDEITFYENSYVTDKIDLTNPNVEADWIIDRKKDGTFKIEGLSLVIRKQFEYYGQQVEDYRNYGNYIFEDLNWKGLVKSMKTWKTIPDEMFPLETYVAGLPSKNMTQAEASAAQTALDLLNPAWYLMEPGTHCCF